MDDPVCCETPMVRVDEFNEVGYPCCYWACTQCGYSSEPVEVSYDA